MWAEILKSKGNFETAKQMYKRALELNASDLYTKSELIKLDTITDPEIVEELERVLIELSEKTVKHDKRFSHCDII